MSTHKIPAVAGIRPIANVAQWRITPNTKGQDRVTTSNCRLLLDCSRVIYGLQSLIRHIRLFNGK
jgi:hypothetical protein